MMKKVLKLSDSENKDMYHYIDPSKIERFIDLGKNRGIILKDGTSIVVSEPASFIENAVYGCLNDFIVNILKH